jgi:dTDP-4-dehydrorhamnose reductase
MRVLVLGATGLLGGEVMSVLKQRGIRAYGAARSGTDFIVDITSQMALYQLLCRVEVDAVINCAACVDLTACEADQEMAYRVNGAPAGVLAAWSLQTSGRFIQVSTDHYFNGDLPVRNDEHALVELKNAYAASKFSGECMTREANNALVVRTNICGARKGFGKWVIDSLLSEAPMGVFTDYFTSTMHVRHCAEGLTDLLMSKQKGLINLASRDVSNKSEFIHAVADAMGITLDWDVSCSAADLTPARALACGLDVRKAETVLGRNLPTLTETVRTLVLEDPRCAMLTTSPLVAAG